MTQCAIYTRVSSERQVREGNGASSQEQRCRAYAASRDYVVSRVFSDQGVSGALVERPALRELLDFVGLAEPGMVVLIDDISRIARDVRVHIELRAAIRAAGGRLESPSLAFEDDPASEFMEIIMAANAQFGRRGNRKQVIDRQRARLEQGFWPFNAPVGYRNAPHPTFKKTIVPTAGAAVLARGLESYAAGRITTKADLARFLVAESFFPRGLGQSVGEKRVTRIFDSLPLYAGYVEYAPWRVARVDGKHEGIISRETFHRLRAREAAPRVGRHRFGVTEEFPLRNFVRCAACGRPLTGSLIKNRYPSYYCYDPACSFHGKRLKGRVLVEEFRILLDRLEAPTEVFDLMERLARDAWRTQAGDIGSAAVRMRRESEALDRQIRTVVQRLASTRDDEVARILEDEAKRLRREQETALARVAQIEEQRPNFAEAWERLSTIVRSPGNYWSTGSVEQKRTVHRVVFTVPPAYDRETGFSTVGLTLPYRISHTVPSTGSCLVDPEGDLEHPLGEELLLWAQEAASQLPLASA